MWTFLGVLFVVAALVMLGIKFIVPLRTEDQTVQNRFGGRDTLKAHPKFLTNWKPIHSLYLGILGILMFLIPMCYIYAQQGRQYYVVNPFGGVTCYYDAGVKIIMPFSRVQEWEKIIDIKTVADGEPTEGIDGVISDFTEYTAKDLETGKPATYKLYGVGARFNDQVRGNIRVSVRIQLPQDDESFIQLVEDFRDPKNLTNNTLIPTVKEQIINCSYMYSAEDYVSGEAANFRQSLDDALKIGGLAVEKHQKLDTIFSEIQDTNGNRQIRDIKTIVDVKPKLDQNGHEIRVQHDITKNKLLVVQVIVDKVNLEPKFQQKLERQRDISAQKSIEIQLTETAQMEQQRIVAQGERDKASKRVDEEKKQVGTLISIETDLKKEETNKQLAAIQLETEKLNAQKMKVAADAKRYELQNANGLSEEVKAKLANDLAKTEAIASAIKDAKWPTTYINGGTGNGNGQQSFLEQLIGAELAKSMLKKE